MNSCIIVFVNVFWYNEVRITQGRGDIMNSKLCFRIENIELYLEQVLVDYMDIPIFFLM